MSGIDFRTDNGVVMPTVFPTVGRRDPRPGFFAGTLKPTGLQGGAAAAAAAGGEAQEKSGGGGVGGGGGGDFALCGAEFALCGAEFALCGAEFAGAAACRVVLRQRQRQTLEEEEGGRQQPNFQI